MGVDDVTAVSEIFNMAPAKGDFGAAPYSFNLSLNTQRLTRALTLVQVKNLKVVMKKFWGVC